MNKAELENLVPEAKGKFVERFPDAVSLVEDVEVYVILNSNREKKRLEVFEYCDARVRSDEPAEGETVLGKKHKAIIIYASVIKSKKRFLYVMWHELGHVYSYTKSSEVFDEAEQDLIHDRDTEVKSGMAVWSELIAEVIAHKVEDAPISKSFYLKEMQMEQCMDEAVNSGRLQTYPLAFFFAMYFADNTVQAWSEDNGGIVPGVNNCNEDIFDILRPLTDLLGRQLMKQDFAKISRNTMVEIGEQINCLWDFCLMQESSNMLRLLATGQLNG